MARTVALALAVVGGACATACSGGSSVLSSVVGVAPKCFDACPKLCQPLDKFITDFTTSGKVTKDAICEDEALLDCAFGDAFAECSKVLAMSSSTGLELPTSVAQWTDFKQKCGPSSSNKGFLSSKKTTGSQKVDDESPEPLDSKNGTQSTNASMADYSDAHQSNASSTHAGETGADSKNGTQSGNESTADQSDANEGNAGSTQVGTTEAPPACNKDDPTVSLVINMAPTCFVKCPALCAAVASQASQMMGGGAPDKATVKRQVCASQDVFACAVQTAHLPDCQAVLSAAASFGVPQSTADLSRLCGEGANDTKSEESSSIQFGYFAGLSAALFAWVMLQ